MTVRFCLVCGHRPRSHVLLIVLLIAGLVLSVALGTTLWYSGRWYERSIDVDKRAQAWERIADGMMQRDLQRQGIAVKKQP